MPPTRWRRPDVPGASSCRRACALSGRAPEKVGWLYSIGHLVRTGGFSVFLTSAHAGVGTLNAELQVARADRVGRATGGSSPSPSGPRLKALKSISFNMGLKRGYSTIFVKRSKVSKKYRTNDDHHAHTPDGCSGWTNEAHARTHVRTYMKIRTYYYESINIIIFSTTN